MTQTSRAKPARKPPARRRTRRSAEEIKGRIIDAAVAEFGRHGFAGARTAAIARRAGVVEPLIFNHFGSKANLFQRAIFETLDRHYSEFVASHEYDVADRSGYVAQSREYVGEQQDFLKENSRMFMSLIVQEAFDTAEFEGIGGLSGLQEFLDKMSNFASSRGQASSVEDQRMVARISFASLLACVLFRDWLFPEGMASDQKIREAVIDFVLKGSDIIPSDESGD